MVFDERTVVWQEHARKWLEQAKVIPNGERQLRLEAFARDVAHVSPGALQRYVRAYVFLTELKAEMSRRGRASGATPSSEALDCLSALEVTHLRQTRRYGGDQFEDMLRDVLAGLRGDRLKAAWNQVRDARGRRGAGTPENSNEHRLRSSVNRLRGLRAAAKCVGQAPEALVIVRNPSEIAPFMADAVATDPSRRRAVAGFRHLGDTGRPGLTTRLNEAVAAALACARAFETFHMVVHGAGDAEEVCVKLAPVGPCGVGVVRFDPVSGRAFQMRPADRTRSGRAPELGEALAALLRSKRLLQARQGA